MAWWKTLMPSLGKEAPAVADERLRMWNLVEDGWWCRVTGNVEVHLMREADLGWEISTYKDGENTYRPTFRKTFREGVDTAVAVFELHERKAADELALQS